MTKNGGSTSASAEINHEIDIWNIDECYIYKVPMNLRNLKEEVYTPQLISIGPLHHDNENLAGMAKHKEMYMQDFCNRREMKLKDLEATLLKNKKLDKVKANLATIMVMGAEQRIRGSYLEKSMPDDSDQYMKMILLDAVFIIELFLKVFENNKEEEVEEQENCSRFFCFDCFRNKISSFIKGRKNVTVEEEEEEEGQQQQEEEQNQLSKFLRRLRSFFSSIKPKEKRGREKKNKEEAARDSCQNHYLLKNPWLKNSIQQDLLLLENQLPYFFLNQLYTLAFPDNHQPNFHELTCQYFKDYNRQNLPITCLPRILHFTDLLRYFMSHSHPEASKKPRRTKIKVNAVKLHDAGVKFKVSKGACLTDIKFKKGILTIPQIEVDNTTECVLRNLVAYEQFRYSSEAYISYYIFLMDCLIDTAKDVELLVEKEIIVNWLGSDEEVAKLFNNLYINITKYNSCYHDICDDLNKYYNSPCRRIMAKLRGVYFSDIWRGTSTVGANILLVLTLLQTISSYYKP